MSILSFKIRKFKSDFPRGKWLENVLDAFGLILFDSMKLGLIYVVFAGKGLSPPLKNLVFFQRKCSYHVKFMFFVLFFFVLYPIMLPSGPSDSAFTQRGAKPRV